jgi:hypothetical protein
MPTMDTLVLDATSIYVPLDTGMIVAIPLTGGMYRTVAPVVGTPSLALTNGALYWLEPVPSYGGPQMVAKTVPVTGGTPKTIELSDNIRGLVNGSSSLFLVASTDAVYASTPPSRIITFDGTSPTVYKGWAQGWIAIDSSFVYFSGIDETLDAVPITGTNPKPIAPIQEASVGIAVDDSVVYFVENTTGRVSEVLKSGGLDTVIVDGQHNPRAIAVDDTSLYWTCIGDGTIKKIDKRIVPPKPPPAPPHTLSTGP